MKVNDIIEFIEENKQDLLRGEYNISSFLEKVNLLGEEEFYELDTYLVSKLKQKDFSILQFSKIKLFPQVKNYIKKEVNKEDDDSWLYAYNYMLHIVYGNNNIPFFNFLYQLIDKKKYDIIEFHLYEIAGIKNEGYVFLKGLKRLNVNFTSQVDSVLEYIYKK